MHKTCYKWTRKDDITCIFVDSFRICQNSNNLIYISDAFRSQNYNMGKRIELRILMKIIVCNAFRALLAVKLITKSSLSALSKCDSFESLRSHNFGRWAYPVPFSC